MWNQNLKTASTGSSITPIKFVFLFPYRFASGGIGESIQFGEEWLTPTKFEQRAGSKSKKYKASIRCEQGITMGEYIAKGYLIENATRGAPKLTQAKTPRKSGRKA